jgi:drug/metabolite transporter (DMT)-like permease
MLPAYFFTTAQTLIPSSVAGMLNALTPMFTLLVGVLLFRSKAQALQVAGIAVGLIGASVLAFQPGMGEGLGQDALGGAARVLAATACYGVSVNVIRHKLHAMPAAGVAGLALGLMGLPAAAFGLTGDLPALVLAHPDGLRGLLAMVVLAVVGTGMALVAFNRIIQRTNALFASTVTYIIPLFATMWGWLDREPLTRWHLLGGVVVVAGVWLVNRGGREASEKAL